MADQASTTRILLWNIQACGAERSPRIAARIRELKPDVIVLNEVHTGTTDPLLEDLQSERNALSWPHCLSSNPPERIGGVAVLAREDLVDRRDSVLLGRDRYRYLPVELPSASLLLWAVYAPYSDGCDEFWPPLQAALHADAQRATVLMGDLNAGLAGDTPATTYLAGNEYVNKLESLGYVDLWRSGHPSSGAEGTWYSHPTNNPFRIDHAFGSMAAADRAKSVEYQHEGREQKLSDHSSLIVTLENAIPAHA